MIVSELIKKKKMGKSLSDDEILFLINAYSDGTLPDYQMSALAMAIWFRGMDLNEIATLTRAMRDSGDKLNLEYLKEPRIDKHSTGGVGDKTSIIIGPILAAAKVRVPMIAGRGLGHTGGTLDKLESLSGFRVGLSEKEFIGHIEKNHFALMGQTESICPADRKLYSLRDVTSTVDSLPLICSSIMSKKLAEDLTGLVLDVKWGSGAFMKTLDAAEELALLLKSTGEKNGVQVRALLTDMNEPLGSYIGNSLEVLECFEILGGKKHFISNRDFYGPTRELTLQLCSHMLVLAGKSREEESGYRLAENLLTSGAAAEAFQQWLEYQGPTNMSRISIAKNVREVSAEQSGFIQSIDTEKIGLAAIELGAGRKTATDTIDHSTGFEMLCRIGDEVSAGQPLMKIYYNTEVQLKAALDQLDRWVAINPNRLGKARPLVTKVII